VFKNSFRNAICDTDIKSSIVVVCQDVNIISKLFSHATLLYNDFEMLKQVQHDTERCNCMQRRENFWPAFLVVLLLCFLILALSFFGKLNFLSSFLEKGTSAVQTATFGIFNKLPFTTESAKIKKLEEANLDLLSRLAVLEKLKKENQALSDQFQTAYPKSFQLLKADVIGAPGFIPGVSVPDVFILNRGTKDNVKKGCTVVFKNNLVGVVSQVSENLAKVDLVDNPAFSFTAKTENGAAGLIKGSNTLVLDGILLSENVKTGELVLTKGSVNSSGIGILPDLVVGKVTSVEKNPSDLFQRARVESFVNFVNLDSVFVFTQIK
jgi:rod shape-determining protein MreC